MAQGGCCTTGKDQFFCLVIEKNHVTFPKIDKMILNV